MFSRSRGPPQKKRPGRRPERVDGLGDVSGAQGTHGGRRSIYAHTIDSCVIDRVAEGKTNATYLPTYLLADFKLMG